MWWPLDMDYPDTSPNAGLPVVHCGVHHPLRLVEIHFVGAIPALLDRPGLTLEVVKRFDPAGCGNLVLLSLSTR